MVGSSDGAITVPYAGRVKVAGKTPRQVEQEIVLALTGKAIEPQALVTVTKNIANTVTVVGEVTGGARVPLSARGDRVLDAVATAGGTKAPAYDTFVTQLARLPDETRVFPGHEYLARNLEFTLDREPDNADAAALLASARHHDPAAARITTLHEEKRINTFFRLQSPTVVARVREAFPDVGEHPDARTVFLRLRELRNRW